MQRKKFGAISARKIKSAGLDEAFQHLAIGHARIEPRAEILQRSEIASLFAFANYRFHCAFADVFDRGEAVTNGVVAWELASSAAIVAQRRGRLRLQFPA